VPFLRQKKTVDLPEKKFRPYIDMMGTSKKPVPESWPLGPFRDVSQDTTVLEDPTQTLSAYKLETGHRNFHAMGGGFEKATGGRLG